MELDDTGAAGGSHAPALAVRQGMPSSEVFVGGKLCVAQGTILLPLDTEAVLNIRAGDEQVQYVFEATRNASMMVDYALLTDSSLKITFNRPVGYDRVGWPERNIGSIGGRQLSAAFVFEITYTGLAVIQYNFYLGGPLSG